MTRYSERIARKGWADMEREEKAEEERRQEETDRIEEELFDGDEKM
jgi:hypothetical protein